MFNEKLHLLSQTLEVHKTILEEHKLKPKHQRHNNAIKRTSKYLSEKIQPI